VTDILDELLGGGARHDGRIFGVVIGVVTNNQDKDGLGRVKVKFPWLSEDDESNWARIAAPMTGDKVGVCFLPEVDDEVLVVFEHGRVDRPFVLGSVWNGKKKPPVTNDDGNNDVRIIKSRSGLTIELNDKSGKEKITIGDKDGKNQVVIDVGKKAFTIRSDGDLTLEAKGKISLVSKDGDVEIKGQGVTVDAKAEAAIKGKPVNLNNGKLKVQG
jgi:uncharacterized protein involved in type VI secretion and phage assembly